MSGLGYKDGSEAMPWAQQTKAVEPPTAQPTERSDVKEIQECHANAGRRNGEDLSHAVDFNLARHGALNGLVEPSEDDNDQLRHELESDEVEGRNFGAALSGREPESGLREPESGLREPESGLRERCERGKRLRKAKDESFSQWADEEAEEPEHQEARSIKKGTARDEALTRTTEDMAPNEEDAAEEAGEEAFESQAAQDSAKAKASPFGVRKSMLSKSLQSNEASATCYQGNTKPPSTARVDWGRGNSNGLGGKRRF